jgi:hypothetical protein
MYRIEMIQSTIFIVYVLPVGAHCKTKKIQWFQWKLKFPCFLKKDFYRIHAESEFWSHYRIFSVLQYTMMWCINYSNIHEIANDWYVQLLFCNWLFISSLIHILLYFIKQNIEFIVKVSIHKLTTLLLISHRVWNQSIIYLNGILFMLQNLFNFEMPNHFFNLFRYNFVSNAKHTIT